MKWKIYRERFRLRSRQADLTATKERVRVMMPAHPMVAKIGCIQFKRLFTWLSLQTTFVRVTGYRLPPKDTVMIRDQVCSSSNAFRVTDWQGGRSGSRC